MSSIRTRFLGAVALATLAVAATPPALPAGIEGGPARPGEAEGGALFPERAARGLPAGPRGIGRDPRATPTRAAADRPVAFTHVAVVPMDRERVIADQTVLVRDGRIVAMGDAAVVEVPDDALRIDGRGRWLMPGLADMHTHLFTDGHWPATSSR